MGRGPALGLPPVAVPCSRGLEAVGRGRRVHGALLIGIMQNAMTIIDISNIYQNLIKAAFLLVAIVNLTTSIGTFVAIPVILRFF